MDGNGSPESSRDRTQGERATQEIVEGLSSGDRMDWRWGFSVCHALGSRGLVSTTGERRPAWSVSLSSPLAMAAASRWSTSRACLASARSWRCARLALCCSFVACGPSASVPADTGPAPVQAAAAVELDITDGVHITETVAACTEAAAAAPHLLVCVKDGEATWIDESRPGSLVLGAAHSVDAVMHDGVPWLVVDDTLYTLQADALDPLDLGLPVPVTRLERAGGTTWLWGAGRLFEVRGDAVHEIVVDGAPVIRDFAASASHLFVAGPALTVLARSADGLTVQDAWPGFFSGLAVDGDGSLWGLVDGVPHVWTGAGELLPITFSEPISALFGPDLWMVGGSGVYHLQGRELSHHPMSTAGVVGSDSLGRLLQIQDAVLVRHALGRPVAVPELPDSLEVQQEVLLLPTDPESVARMVVHIDDLAMSVTADPWQVTLVPDDVPAGRRELRIFTESELGDHIAIHPLWVGALPDVRWSEVQAISETHCVSCHAGDTTTRLDTADAWRVHIERILELVNAGEMPLGSSALSADDIVTIRAWQHGGFQ